MRTAAERAALEYAERLAEICAQVLGRRLLSLILHGSLTFDDYVPGQSDIDLLAVIDQALSDSEVDSLTSAIAAERARAPAPVDLRLVTRAVPQRRLRLRRSSSTSGSRQPGHPRSSFAGASPT